MHMSVNSVLVFYRPKTVAYGMYKCEERAETQAKKQAIEDGHNARLEAKKQAIEDGRNARWIERENDRKAHPFDGIHPCILCDICGDNPIQTTRWECKECEDFDVCGLCKETRLKDKRICPHNWSDFVQMQRGPSSRSRSPDKHRVGHGNYTKRTGVENVEDPPVMPMPPPQPRLSEEVEAGFDYVNLLEFCMPDYDAYGTVTKHDEVSTAFYEKVKTRLARDGKCPLTSGHVRIPFGITIEGRIPSTGVELGAKAIGENKPALTCHLMHMREGMFMEYLDTYHGLPDITLSVRSEHNTGTKWTLSHDVHLMETLQNDIYHLKHFTVYSNIIPVSKDVEKLVDEAKALLLNAKLAAHGASQEEVDDVKIAVKHNVDTRFEADSAHVRYTTMSAAGTLFPHVPGHDIAAIIPVTLRVQVVVGACDICSHNDRNMAVLCNNNHEMCVNCADNWKHVSDSCPFCRGPLLHNIDASIYTAAWPDTFDMRKIESNIYAVRM